MKIYSENEHYKLYQGNMLDMLEAIKPNTIDSIITDPPYELNFMGKGWDNTGIAFQKETWQKCFEVLKPGGYLLAFGGSRTFYRIACAIEDAGFEIRDTIMWLYGSGFPKSENIGLAIDKKNGIESKVIGKTKIGKTSLGDSLGWDTSLNMKAIKESGQYEIKQASNEWQGWGTCLKPSFEPIIVARKPFKGSLVDNVLTNGVGGLNIDECRIDNSDADKYDLEQRGISKATGIKDDGKFLDGIHNLDAKHGVNNIGRFPANTILTYDDTDFNEVCGGFPNTKSGGGKTSMPDLRDVGHKQKEISGIDKLSFGQIENAERKESNYIAPCDSGSASRYFYNAKASKKDRDEGLEELETKMFNRMRPDKNEATGLNKEGRFAPVPIKNIHPTVKPTDLMQYLIRLVSPKGATILDCFNGSGSTGKAVMYENRERDANYKYIGIEMTEEYLPISQARIEYVCNLPKEEKQITIDDILENKE